MVQRYEDGEDDTERVKQARTAYAQGYKFEDRVRDHLKDRGWSFVLRNRLSRGAADLVAIRPAGDGLSRVLMVQCKKGGKITPGEWNALFDWATQAGGLAVVAELSVDGEVILYRRALARVVTRGGYDWAVFEP
jgi:hypothetical protein